MSLGDKIALAVIVVIIASVIGGILAIRLVGMNNYDDDEGYYDE